MGLAPDRAQLVNDICAKLTDEYYAAQSEVASRWGLPGDYSKEQIQGELRKDIEMIGRLHHGDLYTKLAAGTFSWEQWQAVAEGTHDDMNYQSGLTNDWSFKGVLGSTADETLKEVVKLPQKAAEALLKPLVENNPWLAVGAVALLLLFLAVRFWR